MEKCEITCYASRSTRKNAKTIYQTFSMFPGTHSSKKRFSDSDREIFRTWAQDVCFKFPVFHVVAFVDNVPVCTWQAYHLSIYQATRQVLLLMDMMDAAAAEEVEARA